MAATATGARFPGVRRRRGQARAPGANEGPEKRPRCPRNRVFSKSPLLGFDSGLPIGDPGASIGRETGRGAPARGEPGRERALNRTAARLSSRRHRSLEQRHTAFAHNNYPEVSSLTRELAFCDAAMRRGSRRSREPRRRWNGTFVRSAARTQAGIPRAARATARATSGSRSGCDLETS